jgi:uncharacterized protein involved in exopolysaccharide biosynthesis/Mrp family chromosome partitioning ATPase
MNNNLQSDQEPHASSMGIADVYFVVFRRKWLLLGGLVLGTLAAGALWKVKAPLFQSTAKIMVRYVRESGLVNVDPTTLVRAPIAVGANPLATEGEILTSLDVAQEAAAAVGPELICPKIGTTNPIVASLYIKSHVKVEISPQLDVITITSRHESGQVASNILHQVIEAYLKKHNKVHSDTGGSVENLLKQRDQYREAITNADAEIKNLKSSVGIFSLEEFKKANSVEESKLRLELFSAEADLAQARATLDNLRRTTNGQGQPELQPVKELIPSTVLRDYAVLLASIEKMERDSAELLRERTKESPLVQANESRLTEAKQKKAVMEREYPGLLTAAVPVVTAPGSVTAMASPAMDLNARAAQIPGLQARIIALSNQLAEVQHKATQVEEIEPTLTKLQKERDRLDSNLTLLDSRIQQRQMDQAFGNANIQGVQAASVPMRDFKLLYKTMAGAVFGGLGLGLGLAFLLELVLDRSVRRPKDLEALAGAPLFLCIPELPLASPPKKKQKQNHAPDQAIEPYSAGGQAPGPEPDGLLRPFHEALRDRLVNYFEARQMTHKPKMVSVTSCDEGAGVSSVAVGLAASLSEIGEGNVLLVDMREAGAAHSFFHGRRACGLMDALEDEARNQAQVQDKLYVVSGATAEQNFERFVPRQFGEFVPKLKASDYEYIIFDMPPVSQTSVTAKVARFMDMILMVTEAGRTSREVATQAIALLAESKATVATVLNKRRRYVPRWLLQEFD